MPSGWKFWPEREPGPVDDAYVQAGWVRPYRPGPVRVASAFGVFAVTVFTAFAGFLAMLAEPSRAGRLLGAVLTVVLAGSLALLGSRVLSVGVWVNDFGVRVLGLARSSQLPWAAVVDVRRVSGGVRLLGTPLRRRGSSLWLILADGTDLETPLASLSPDFVGRAEAYDIAAGTIERWFAETGGASSA